MVSFHFELEESGSLNKRIGSVGSGSASPPGIVAAADGTYRNPLVPDDLVNGQPLLRICLQTPLKKEGNKCRLCILIRNWIHGCFTHLRIVHHTDGPAWMNHLTNCPL